MATGLNEFLARARQREFIWGVHDCCLFAADWVLEQTGVDPAAQFRGTYSSEAEAQALIADGMPALIDQVMQRGEPPILAVVMTAHGEVCAIPAGRFYAVLTEHGTAQIRAPLVAGYSWPL